LALCALRVVVCRLALGRIGRPSGLVEAAQESVSVSEKELVELRVRGLRAEHDSNGANTVGLVALNDTDPELTIEI